MKGMQGIQGIPNIQGIQGMQGMQGIQGMQGMQNLSGIGYVQVNPNNPQFLFNGNNYIRVPVMQQPPPQPQQMNLKVGN